MPFLNLLVIALAVTSTAFQSLAQPAAAQPTLRTRWAADLNPEAPLPEYPRPQLVRDRWLNLNGRWQWAAATPTDQPPSGRNLQGQIIVPFPIESALSGVGEHHERLWYRRTFTIPADWAGQRTILHFGAVDWEARIFINGKPVGEHRGGYDPFSIDITDALTPSGDQELIVGVYDPTDTGEQPRGKQVRKPEGIWYTPVTGIWQTVWLEPVPAGYIKSVEIVPDLANSLFKVRVNTAGEPNVSSSTVITLSASGNQINRHNAPANQWTVVKCGKPRAWRPEDPFLYDLAIDYIAGERILDSVTSYAGIRSIALGKDKKGRTTILLNGEPYLQVGPLDQGWWPDGLYTAPTDEALRYDIEITKQLGFNMARKHVKVEPARWYYWADTLGLLVWQDMPSCGPYIGPNDPDVNRKPESAKQFELELAAMIAAFGNHPSIVMWVPFNEGWGQYDTARIVDLVKKQDPSRLVNNASGWSDRNVGDVIDWHRYPEPQSPKPEAKRAAVLGEFGGLGLPVKGHMWKPENWGYRGMKHAGELTRTYEQFMKTVYDLHEAEGLCAVVYTQTTDVEVECNGLLTYDRAIIKPDLERIAAANKGDFSRMPPPPVIKTIIPTSQEARQTWRYTVVAPSEGWIAPAFDDSGWKEAPGGFGTKGTPSAVIGTEWKTSQIWARRTFQMSGKPDQNLRLLIHHDENCQVFINGVLAANLEGFSTSYEDHPIAIEALAAIKDGPNTLAVTCKQTGGGQFIDVGLVTVTEQPPPNPAPAGKNALPGQPADNIAPNSAFDNAGGDGKAPDGWRISRWGGKGDLNYTKTEGRGNSPAVTITSDSGGDLSWSTTIPVEMNSRYKLSGWIKTKGIKPIGNARGALFNIHGTDFQTRALTGDHDWTLLEAEFDTGLNDSVMLNCLFGGWGLATGTAWFDDVQLVLLKKGHMPAPYINIDAARIGEPISSYIYGQFIEHLGRCIYGGIWAEMIEDRKFFDPVGSKGSPWKAIGSTAITMQADSAFVGAYSPMISPAGPGFCGIRQEGLGVRPGIRCTGHIWLAGDPSAAPITISLKSAAWNNHGFTVEIPTLSREFTREPIVFHTENAAKPTDDAWIEITSAGKGSFRIGTLSLMPADNVEGFRADTLALLKELDSPVYRWPGGNFVSGYDWRDGIGDRDRRPPRKNPAWKGIEPNDVGIHEFMTFCSLLATEPYIAVNAGDGTSKSAAEQLEYVNGSTKTAMGRQREKNGRERPWNVKYWGIGNEMYGDWQIGHIPLDKYLKRHAEFAAAMRAVDPSIKLIGVGAVGDWSRAMLRDNADTMSYLSEHVYWQNRDGLAAHVRQAPDSLRSIASAHRAYRLDLPSLVGKDIRIVQDEWNYWYGPEVFGELGTRYFMKDALGVAAALHEFARNSDIFFMANYAQTVNVIGAIKTTTTSAQLETTGEVLKLYRHHFGTVPVRVDAGPLIDVAAAWTTGHQNLTIAIVNPTMNPANIPLSITGALLTGSEHARGDRYEIAASDPLAFNDPGKPPLVAIKQSTLTGPTNSITLAPCSVTLFKLPAKPAG